MMHSRLAGLTLAASLVLGACHGSLATKTQASAADTLSDAMCRHFARCQGLDVNVRYAQCRRDGWWINRGTIIPATASSGALSTGSSGIDSTSQLEAALTSGAIQQSSADLSACVADIEASACELTFSFKQVPSCVAALHGKLADGAACESSLACGPSSYCQQASTGCTATCQPGSGACVSDDGCAADEFCSSKGSCLKSAPSHPGLSEACGATSRCADGLYCPLPAPNSSTCQARAAEGKPCSWSQLCLPGLFCGASQTCQKQGALGEACDPSPFARGRTGACLQGACLAKPGSHSTGVCAMPFKAASAACSLVNECDGNLHCDATTGTCVPNPSTGPCAREEADLSTTGGPTLVYDLAACDSASAFCDMSDSSNPVCRPFLAQGAACRGGAGCPQADHEVCGPADGFAGIMGVCHVPTSAALCKAWQQ
jgi:hypothetical protein